MAGVSPPENSIVYGLRIQPFLNQSQKQGCGMGLESPRFSGEGWSPTFIFRISLICLSNTLVLGPLLK